jgi:hypothetical protein
MSEALRARCLEFYQMAQRRGIRRQGSPVDDLMAFVKTELAPTVRTDRVITILSKHYLMGVHCNHENKTDRAQCFCTVWRGPEMPSVGDAVASWIDHIVQELHS